MFYFYQNHSYTDYQISSFLLFSSASWQWSSSLWDMPHGWMALQVSEGGVEFSPPLPETKELLLSCLKEVVENTKEPFQSSIAQCALPLFRFNVRMAGFGPVNAAASAVCCIRPFGYPIYSRILSSALILSLSTFVLLFFTVELWPGYSNPSHPRSCLH